MAVNRWLDRTQPQTLVIATIVLYINAGFAVISLEIFSLFGALMVAAGVVGALGIANEKKLGYWLAVAATGFGLLQAVVGFSFSSALNLLFLAALLGLLLHPQSREYRRIWFK